MLYMVTFTITIPPRLAYIPAPWILRVMINQKSGMMADGHNHE